MKEILIDGTIILIGFGLNYLFCNILGISHDTLLCGLVFVIYVRQKQKGK